MNNDNRKKLLIEKVSKKNKHLTVLMSLVFAVLGTTIIFAQSVSPTAVVNGYRPMQRPTISGNRFREGFQEYVREHEESSPPLVDTSIPGPDGTTTKTNECPTGKPVMRSTGEKLLFEQDFSSNGADELGISRNYKVGVGGIFGNDFHTEHDTGLVFTYVRQYRDINQDLRSEYVVCDGRDGYCIYKVYNELTIRDYVDHLGDWGGGWVEYRVHYIYVAQISVKETDGSYIELTGYDGTTWLDDNQRYTLRLDAQGNYTLTSIYGGLKKFTNNGRTLRAEDARGVGYTYVYNAEGRFSSVNHDNGRSMQFTWTPLGNVASVTAPNGAVYQYQYNNIQLLEGLEPFEGGQLARVIYPGNLGVRSYRYDANGRVIGIDMNGVPITQYTYHADGRVHTSGAVGGVEKSTFVYGNNAQGMYTTETNALGLSATHSYRYQSDGQNRLTSVDRAEAASCPGASQLSTYDENSFLSSQTDWAGNKSEYDYDDKGRMVKETIGIGPNNDRAAAKTFTYTWDDANTKLQSKTTFAADGTTALTKTIFDYFPVNDQAGRSLLPSATTLIDCTPNCDAGPRRRIEYRYSVHPNKILATVEVDGALAGTADTIRYNYSAQGDLTTSVNALGQTETYQNYNGLGQPGHVITTAGVGTTYNYDAKGRITSSVLYTLRGAITTTYQYDAEDRVTYVTDGHGWVRNSYDVQGRLVRIEKPGTNPGMASSLDVVEYTYNLLSQPTNIKTKRIDTAANGVSTTTLFSNVNKNYNTAGLLISETGNNGQNVRYEYNSNAQLSVTYDSLNQATRYYYDSHDRLNKVVSPVGTTHKGFDHLGRLAYVIDSNNNRTNYFYNNFGNLVREESPAAGATTFSYDQAGRLISKSTADGRTTNYNLDLLGRSTTISSTWPTALAAFGSLHQTFTFDSCAWGAGKLCSVSDLTGSLIFEYDATAGMKRQQYNTENGKSYAYEYTFDALDRPVAQTYSDSSAIVYHYTPQSTVSQVLARAGANGAMVSVADTIKYAPFGAYTNLNHGNGIFRARTFDLDGRLTSIGSGATAISKNFSYNANNLITNITNNLDAGNTQTFTYDTVSRLTNVASAAGGQAFAYDANSNRTSHTWGGGTDTYQLATGNRLAGITGARPKTFVNDAVGNRETETVNGVTTEHYYDAFNREIWLRRYSPSQRCEPNKGACEQLPSGTWQYGVNAFGQRAYKYTMSTNNDVYAVRHYMYGADGNLTAEADGSQGSLQTEYIWFGGEPIGVIRNGQVYRIHSDHLNRPEAVSNNAGAVVWQAKNFAFDRVVVSDTIGGLNIGFPGQYFDAESNTWYNHHRQYDGLNGRYTQSDPIGLAGGTNTFGYVGGDPMNVVDPSGLVFFARPHVLIRPPVPRITAPPMVRGPGPLNPLTQAIRLGLQKQNRLVCPNKTKTPIERALDDLGFPPRGPTSPEIRQPLPLPSPPPAREGLVGRIADILEALFGSGAGSGSLVPVIYKGDCPPDRWECA
jgi:RHS repeat-associated protein